jgi:hypothetical protein
MKGIPMRARGFPKSYKIKTPRKQTPYMVVSKPTVVVEKEQLFGVVRDMKASDIEERFARSLDRMGVSYWFRLPVGAPRGMPGYNELDFLVQSGGYYPIQIDGEYSHLGKEAKDMIADARIMEELKQYSPMPITHVMYMKLSNQKASDMVAREILG